MPDGVAPVDLLYLVGFKNRVRTVLHWAVSFLGRGRPERVSTFQQAYARSAIDAYGDPFERAAEAARSEVAARSRESVQV